MTEIKGDIPEIIRLQLRKPTRWGWELSTYKPSAKVSLPTIQLYNYKGQLLVEARDNGETERSWRSSTLQNKGSTANAEKESSEGHLRRSRSDTLGCNSNANISRNKFESINRKDGNRRPNNRIKSSERDNSSTKETADAAEENREIGYKTLQTGQGIDIPRSTLKKSKSDTSQHKGNLLCKPSISKRNSIQTLQEFTQDAETRHRRSKSDDLLRRRLRSSEESVKRAELDGYINFITPNIPHHKSQNKPNRNKKVLTTAETVSVDNNGSGITINDCTPKKYRTKTSSAGTLIISEESFNDAHRRRRRENVDENSLETKRNGVESNVGMYNVTVDSGGLRHMNRQVDDSVSSVLRRNAFNNYPTISDNRTLNKFSSQSTGESNREDKEFKIMERNDSQIPNGYSFNSISEKNAFNENLDIAHSRSTGSIQNSDIISKTCLKDNIKKYDRSLGFIKHVRPMSDPTSWIYRKYAFNPKQDGSSEDCNFRETHNTPAKRINPSSRLFYSRSDVFPFHEILNDKIDENVSDNCNYAVQEPNTPSIPSESRKNSQVIIEKLNRKRQRKVCGRSSDGSTSSNTIEKGSRTKDYMSFYPARTPTLKTRLSRR